MKYKYDKLTKQNEELKDILASLLHIYKDKTFGDNVWRLMIEEKAQKLLDQKISNKVISNNTFWQNEYEKLRREFAELQGDELILSGKIKQLEADIENLTIN